MKHTFSGLIKTTLVSAVAVVLISCGGAEERKVKYLEKGKTYLEEKNYDKARIEFKNVLQIDPKYAEVYYYMGLLEENKKSFIKAVNHYKKAIELKPDYIDAKVKLATIYVIGGTKDYIEKAVVLLDEVLAVDPVNSEAKFVYATIDYKKGNQDKAIAEMEAIVENDIYLVGGIGMLSNIYISKGYDVKAINLLKKAVVDNPDDIYLKTNLSRALTRQGDVIEAENQLKDVVRMNPDDYSLQILLSQFYVKTDQLEKAEDVLRDGIEADDNDVQRYLALIQLVASNVSVEEAEKELKQAIDNKPDLHGLKFALVKLYQETGDREKAKSVLTDIIKDYSYDVSGVNARIGYAKMLIEEGDVDGAKKYVDPVLSEHPNDNDALTLHGRISLVEKDYTAAINALRTVVKNEPKNSSAALLLAQAYEYNNDTLLAERELQRSIEANPLDEAAYINYARYLLVKGRTSEAEDVVDNAVTYFKDSYQLLEIKLKLVSGNSDDAGILNILDIMEKLEPKKPEVNLYRGNYYVSTNRIENGIEEFEKAYEKSSEKYKILELITRTYVQNGKVDTALERLKPLLSESAYMKAVGYHLTAKVYLSTGKMQDASTNFNRAIEAAEEWLPPYLSLGEIYIAEKEYKKAMHLYQKALNSVDNKNLVMMQVAALHEREGNYDDAIKVYADLVEQNETNMVAKNNMAALLLDHGTSPEELKKALNLSKEFENIQQPAFQDTLAWAYTKSGDHQKAIDILQSIVERSPEMAVFRYHLGYALYHSGDKAAAKSHLKIAVDSDQDFPGKIEAEALLKEI